MRKSFNLKIVMVVLSLTAFQISNVYAQQILYSTFIGGRNNDGCSNWLNEFAVDSLGNIIFTADTESPDFPVTADAYDKTYNGGNDWGVEDNVIVKFNTKENKLVYSSFFGGRNGPDFIKQVCLHENNLYLVGNTGSSDYPTTVNAYDRTFNGPVFRHSDGVISKFKGNELVYSTFIGSSGMEVMHKVLFDAYGNMIAVGQIAKPNEIPFNYKFSNETLADNPNGCVIKFNASGSSILSSSLLGPVWEMDAAIDSDGYIYITGTTPSKNFPVTQDVFDNTYNGGNDIAGGDIFVMKLSPQGDSILFSTFLGGSGNENFPVMKLDHSGNIIIYGRTSSKDFPITGDALDKTFTGSCELFIAKLSSDGKNLIYSSYLGGLEKSGGEWNNNLLLSDCGDLYVTGTTDADDHPVSTNALKSSISGGSDIFITVFDSTLKQIKYSTLIGGKATDGISAIALDDNENIICVGATESSDFPTTKGAYKETKNGGFDIVLFVLSPVNNPQTRTEINDLLPQDILLNQNYPNPFNPSTNISYSLPVAGNVKLSIYNLLSQKVKTLVDSYQVAGKHSTVWDATDNSNNPVSSGIYFYQMKSNNQTLQKKMLLVR